MPPKHIGQELVCPYCGNKFRKKYPAQNYCESNNCFLHRQQEYQKTYQQKYRRWEKKDWKKGERQIKTL